jgi:RNA polymerase sigma-70 factor (ECF subfamily)
MSPAALAAFERAHLDARTLAAALFRIDRSPAFADEVRQAVSEKLFVDRPGSPARIGDYSGKRPLSTWLRVIVVRVAIDLRRGGGAANAPGDEGAADNLAAGTSPELRYLKARYGKAFQQAVTEALASLDDEQCNLLRLQLVDGLRTSQIAQLFGVDRSTIKRRLAACRDRLKDEVQERLRSTLRLSPTELESLAGLVQSQLHVSLAGLLRAG